MYDVNKNTRISSVHTYNTRASTSEHFYTKESLLNVKRNAFSRVGVKIWNGIPQILKERPKKALKRSLKEIFYVLHDMAENRCKFMHDNHGKFRRTALTFCQDTFTLFGCY